MKIFLEVLRKCPLFFNIDDGNLITMLGCLGARVDKFDKKYTVFAEGSQAKYIGIVLSGSVQITQLDYYGNRSILTSIGKGEIFAEAFACADIKELPVSVIANEPSEIMLIDCKRILNVCTAGCAFHNQLIYNLMKDIATKAVMFQQKIEVTTKRTTRDKIMAYLMLCAKKTGSSSFEIPFDRQELADYLEVDRTGLSNEISKLRREGVLESRRSYFHLL